MPGRRLWILLPCALTACLHSRPASTEVIDPTPQRLARGEYLAEHVSDCFHCHSQFDYDRYGLPIKAGTRGAGGFCFGKDLGVPGKVCAHNITPDKETGIGSWTDGEILRAIREGISADGHPLFPMMPYTDFKSLSDEDARSIVVYLRTIPPVKRETEATDIQFPVNIFIRGVPRPLEAPVEEPSHNDTIAYGKYLSTLGGCIECHTSKNSHGRPNGPEGAGGWLISDPNGHGGVITPNITPDTETGLGGVTRPGFIALFKSFAELAGDPPPAAPDRLTVMPWYALSGATEEDLGAIYDYLRTLPPIHNPIDPYATQSAP